MVARDNPKAKPATRSQWALRVALVGILLLLANSLFVSIRKASAEACESKARTNVAMIAEHVRSWMIRHDRDAGLPSLADLTKVDESGPAELVEVPVDPWGSPYEVVAGTKEGTFEAVSPGPDRRVGTADDIRHVGLVRPR